MRNDPVLLSTYVEGVTVENEVGCVSHFVQACTSVTLDIPRGTSDMRTLRHDKTLVYIGWLEYRNY